MATVLRRWNLDWTTISVSGATQFVPAGDFEAVPGGDSIRGWLEFRNEVGTFTVAVAAQLANDPDSPDSTGTSAMTAVTTEGVSSPTTPVSFDVSQRKYVRPGYNASSGSGSSGGRVRGVLELLQS